MIDNERIKQNLGMSRGKYRQFVNEGIDAEDDIYEKVYAGFILGSVGFVKDMLKDMRKRVLDSEISYRKYVNKGIEIYEIASEVGVICHIESSIAKSSTFFQSYTMKVCIEKLRKTYYNMSKYDKGFSVE